MTLGASYVQKIQTILDELGFASEYLKLNQDKMYMCVPENSLEVIHENVYHNPAYCTLATKQSWGEMLIAARTQNIFFKIVSSYRSIDYQAQLIRNKLNKGVLLVDILKVNAAPGFSEHHTGRALDLTSADNDEVLTENFENTQAFTWLCLNAKNFGFELSYPKNNDKGFIYEPWHWCLRAN